MTDSRLSLVQRLFSGTGSTYDFVVNVGTFGCDRSWKRKILAKVPSDCRRILDLACGTGIITLAIARRIPESQVIGVDITPEYLDEARRKADRLGIRNVAFYRQAAETIAFDRPFDCVTASYLPKYADLSVLSQKVAEALTEGGLFIVHDFTYPSNAAVAALWEFYFKILQTVGSRLLPSWRTIFNELPGIVRNTTWLPDLLDALRQTGFEGIIVERLIVGSATIVTARNGKPRGPAPGGSRRG